MKRIVFMLLLVGLFPTNMNAHEFYLSITSIRHHPETQKLTIRIRIFVNDLEEAIFQDKQIRIGLWKNKPVENAQAYVEDYVKSRLSISVNGSIVPLEFLNQKVESAEILEDHVIICELEAKSTSKINSIKVRNTMLTETIDSQINIVNIRANDTKKVINLDRRISEDQIDYR